MIPDSTVTKPRTADQRRQAFVDAARQAFFSSGYGGTSMSAISAKVGGSKTTLWTYFPSKQELFAAVVDDLVERYGRALEVPLDPDADIAESLRGMARAMLQTIHSQPIVDLHRIAIGEANRSPEVARLFWERGPARGKARLQQFIRDLMLRGRLREGDALSATRQFAGMLQMGSVQQHLLGIADKPGQAALEQEIEAAVDAFMRAWTA